MREVQGSPIFRSADFHAAFHDGRPVTRHAYDATPIQSPEAGKLVVVWFAFKCSGYRTIFVSRRCRRPLLGGRADDLPVAHHRRACILPHTLFSPVPCSGRNAVGSQLCARAWQKPSASGGSPSEPGAISGMIGLALRWLLD